MIVYPAIDLRGGKCVRLVEGKVENETVFSEEPAVIAHNWESQGAAWLHLVDLDAAFTGELVNLPVVKAIIKKVGIPVQLGGGIRNLETIDALIDAGLGRVIIGTAAINDPAMVEAACSKYGEKIVVGIDAKDGRVAVKGWVETTSVLATELVSQMIELGVQRIIYTDIARDGKLCGPNIKSIGEVLHSATIPVIASGGIGSLVDLEKIKELEGQGVEGVIVGKALYTGNVKLADAIKILKC